MTPFEPVVEREAEPRIIEPPLSSRISYRLGWGIDESYRPWVERDVASTAFVLWQLITFVVGGAVGLSIVALAIEDFNVWPTAIGWTIGAMAASLFFRDYKRRRFLEHHEKKWKKEREKDQLPDHRTFP